MINVVEHCPFEAVFGFFSLRVFFLAARLFFHKCHCPEPALTIIFGFLEPGERVTPLPPLLRSATNRTSPFAAETCRCMQFLESTPAGTRTNFFLLCVRVLLKKTGDQPSLAFLAARKIPASVNRP